jgi:RHS repeat-associated protein
MNDIMKSGFFSLIFGDVYFLQRNSEFDSRYKFTAKELDNETIYTYFGARYYDSDLSIWLSVDPLADDYPSLSPYIYCANNPIVYIDPDGRSFDEWGIDAAGNIKHLSFKEGPDELYRIDSKGNKIEVNKDGNFTEGVDFIVLDREMTDNLQISRVKYTENANGEGPYENRLKMNAFSSNVDKVREVYSFLIEPDSAIEYSLVILEKSGTRMTFINTTGEERRVRDTDKKIDPFIKDGWTVSEFRHNHPSGTLNASDGDKTSKDIIKAHSPNAIFYIDIKGGKYIKY